MKNVLFVFFFLGGCSLALAQAYTLESAIEYALEHNFNTKKADNELLKAHAQVKETKAMGYPQISGQIDFNNFINIPTQVAPADAFGFPDYINDFLFQSSQALGVPINLPDPANQPEFSELQFGTKYNTTAGITANQLLFDGVYFYGLKAAKSYINMAQLESKKTKTQIKEDVYRAFYLVLIAQKNIGLQKEGLVLAEKTYQEVQALKKAGFTDQEAVQRQELMLLNIESRIKKAENQMRLAKQVLKFQMGYPIDQSIELQGDLDLLKLRAATYNAQNSLDYQIADYRIALLELNHKVNRAEILPKLYGFFSHSENAFSNSFGYKNTNWYPTTLWGLQLKVPIFSGFSYKANLSKSKSDLLLANQAKAFTEQGLALELSQANIEFDNALESLQMAEKKLNLTQSISASTRKKYKEGLVSSSELTINENEALLAKGEYIGALIDLIEAQVKFKQFENHE